MNSLFKTITLLACIAILPSCSSYQNTVRGAFASVGVPSIRDIWAEEFWEKNLPQQLALPPSQIETEFRAGYTMATISGIEAGTRRDELQSKLEALQNQNPEKPLKWTFE